MKNMNTQLVNIQNKLSRKIKIETYNENRHSNIVVHQRQKEGFKAYKEKRVSFKDNENYLC